MDYLLPAFKVISVTFAMSAVATGAQAIVDPVGFSRFFGMPVHPTTTGRSLTRSYIALMGVRQLATGIILLTFAYQEKWTEVATILAIIGMVVAGTDGMYLLLAGHGKLGKFHAIPGARIAALAVGVLYSSD